MELGNSSNMPAEDGLDLDRISLRPFNPSDVDDFMLYANDERVGRFLNNWNPIASKEHALEVLNHKIDFHPWFKSICLDNKSIGSVAVSGRNLASEYRCRAEIGYALRPDYWNKGIATHAVQMVANAIFWEWPHLERLEALVDVENVASQRVLEKAGFEREAVLKKYYILKGQTRDVVIYSFLSNTRESQDSS